jgi:hypothetical protein
VVRDELLRQAEACLGELAADGILRPRAIEALQEARRLAEAPREPGICEGAFPPLFYLLATHRGDTVRALEQDLQAVLEATRHERRADVLSFLTKGPDEFSGGLFEVHVKATALRSHLLSDVELDSPTGEGARECDILCRLDGRPTVVEATVLLESEYEQETTRRALAAGAKTWGSPGPYDPPGSKWPSPYYTTVRIYAKVYEKLAPKLQPNACQFPERYPGVLAVSLDGVHRHICRDETEKPFEAGVYWAFDELFLDQPWGSQKVAAIDTTLPGWLWEHARGLVESGRVKAGAESATFDELIALPRRVSGVLMFHRGCLVDSRLNYHANRRLNHAEMAALETVFAEDPRYL